MATILNGKQVAAEIRAELKTRAEALRKDGTIPCLAVLLAVLSVGMVIEGFVGKAYRNSNEVPINVKSSEMKGVYWMLLIFAVYCVVLRFGGFILASVIFIPSVMWVLGERKWLRAILVGVIATAAIYALFKFGLRVRLPQGVLFKL